MKANKWFIAIAAALVLSCLTGCADKQAEAGNAVKLDPNNPVTLTVWHYYNGAQQAAFDMLVQEFNATAGKEKGIHVEGYSQGSVSDLEKAITDSVAGKVGAQSMPDVFSTYADTAYAVQQQGKLADLSPYFTQEELNSYVDGYIQEGYFQDDQALYLFPVAKSTEVMMLNATDWAPFAEATGTKLEELNTVEGVTQVAQRYYEWTDSLTPDISGDGKAFYGRDSMSNYFIIGMKQMGVDIFDVKDGNVTLRPEKEQIHRLWENYYVPYVKGYFTSLGKFRSDDVKTGDILAYTGSTSSAMYFPNEVVLDTESKPIDYLVLPVPIMEGGQRYYVQQGAGMAVTKSDAMHEYAACEFMKWFTAKENNLRFVCESSYFPVRKDANTLKALDDVIQAQGLKVNPKTYDCLNSILSKFDSISFYTPKCFSNGYATRKVLDFNLSDKAAADKAAIEEAVAAGTAREEAVAPYVTEEAFEAWCQDFCQALEAKAH